MCSRVKCSDCVSGCVYILERDYIVGEDKKLKHLGFDWLLTLMKGCEFGVRGVRGLSSSLAASGLSWIENSKNMQKMKKIHWNSDKNRLSSKFRRNFAKKLNCFQKSLHRPRWPLQASIAAPSYTNKWAANCAFFIINSEIITLVWTQKLCHEISFEKVQSFRKVCADPGGLSKRQSQPLYQRIGYE